MTNIALTYTQDHLNVISFIGFYKDLISFLKSPITKIFLIITIPAIILFDIFFNQIILVLNSPMNIKAKRA